METHKFNEYEQREAKNFILLESHKVIKAEPKKLQLLPHKMRKPTDKKSGPIRIRSASTGRDKRSEFHARYWAFLFGNLQRAVDEIYKTVEHYENVESCCEAILVLENYIREFKALAEFFKMSWNYERTPQRPQSVAWEVRKTSAVPRVRNRNNMSSPAISGKSSPSCSESPCPTIDEHKPVSSPNKISNKESSTVEFAMSSLTEKERKFEQLVVYFKEADEQIALQKPKSLSLENLNQNHDMQTEYFFNNLVIKCDSFSQTEGIDDDNLTLQEYLLKYSSQKITESAPDSNVSTKNIDDESKTCEIPTQSSENEENNVEASKNINSNDQHKESSVEEQTTFLSQIIKPKENQKENIKPTSGNSKSQTKPTIKANYSLRNQTISSKNQRVSDVSIRKQAVLSHPSNRISRPQTRTTNANIPSTAAVLNTQPQKNYLGNRSKTMIEMPKTQPRSNRAGELRKKKSIEDNTDSSTSTLKASTEKLFSSKSNLKNSIGDNKTITSKKTDVKTQNATGDGEWFTVKTKRSGCRRSSWATRFDQPSASASLPALALLNENYEDSDKEQSNNKEEKPQKSEAPKTKLNAKPNNQKKESPKSNTVVSSRQPVQKAKPLASSISSAKKNVISVKAKVNSNPPKRVTVVENPKQVHSKNINQNQYTQNTIKRQKSDITGLKIKSLHKEYLRSERSAPFKKKKDSDDDKKVDMNLQTSQVLISETIDELYSELGSKDNSKFTNGSLSSCEEIEERDLESDDDQKKLVEEQENLERQIRELENSEIDLDTETDETDCEAILCDLDDNESSENNDIDSQIKDTIFNDENMTLEVRYAPMLAEMSSHEREETLATLQELVARDPGRAQKLHQKLSSPSRRRSVRETLKKYQVKHTRALEKRITIQQQRAQKIQQLIQRVEQVKAARVQLTENRRLKMEEKLSRATKNREDYLKNKIKKAHDEEEKLKEIAFIKNLEMQNKRLDFIESCKEQEVILLNREQERQKRQTEKLAKEAAVERRRLEIEMERKKKIEKMDENRKEREQRVEKIQEEKEKLRQEIAREKQRDRDKRLQAIQQQQLQDTEELQRKITKKQEEYQKRHEENIEHIKQRAFELAQQRNPDDSKSLNDEEENLENIERTRESVRNAKKKMKKIKERLNIMNQTYLDELPELANNHKKQSQVPKLLNAIKKGSSGNNSSNQVGVERQIGQILRIIEKSTVIDFHCLWLLDLLGILASTIEDGLQPNSSISRVAVVKAIQLFRNASSSCKQIAQHSILGGSFIKLIDALNFTLKNPEVEIKTPTCPVEISTELLLCLTVVLSNLKSSENAAIGQRLDPLLSYLTASGVLELITKKCLKVREPIENQQSLLLPLLSMIGFVTKITEICPRDKSDFLCTMKSTEMFGTITLLYKTMSFGDTIPRRTISLAGSTYGLIKAVALLDVNCFQQILNDERLTFKFLDVVTILLNYCGPKLCESDDKEMKAVIRDLVIILGYFCANNRRNQNLLTSEQSCIILKSITKLPIDLAPVYYPTLLTIIWENVEAEEKLAKDFDVQMLKEYEKSSIAKKNKLLHMLEI